jgi:hypothetical protein
VPNRARSQFLSSSRIDHQHQPANNSNHGRLRFLSIFRASNRRRNACGDYRSGDYEALCPEKEEEEEWHHLDFLQASLALAASEKTAGVAAA